MWPDDGKKARGSAHGGSQGQIAVLRAAKIPPNEGDTGMWGAAEGSTHLEMSVTPISGWMEGTLYHLAQPSNMESCGLDLERPPKILSTEDGIMTLLEQPFQPK